MVTGVSVQCPLRAKLDGEGHLLRADPALLDIHFANGGEEGGVLAMPALLQLCLYAKRLKMRLSRPVSAGTSVSEIDLWATVDATGDTITIEILQWREHKRENPAADPASSARASDVGRAGADGYVRLDDDQKILALHLRGEAPAIAPNDYILHKWTRVFRLTDMDDRSEQPSDWRSYQGKTVQLRGHDTIWRMQIRPMAKRSASGGGFEIFLHAQRLPGSKEHSAQLLETTDLQKMFSGPLGDTLRHPIGRIIANAETIGDSLQGPIRSDYASYARDIAQAGRHLLELVEDLSDLEMVERPDFSAVRDRIDLGDLARRAAGLLAVKASDHNIRIDAPSQDDSMPAIGEFRRVLQILLNLLTNAIRYSPDGSMIWVRLEREDALAQLVVADQGNGLPENDHERIFEKFERLGRSGDGGSGLGLYISRRLARAMGGDLKVESAPGQGARFILELPFDTRK